MCPPFLLLRDLVSRFNVSTKFEVVATLWRQKIWVSRYRRDIRKAKRNAPSDFALYNFPDWLLPFILRYSVVSSLKNHPLNHLEQILYSHICTYLSKLLVGQESRCP